MVSSDIIVLESLPMVPNGKIDSRQLSIMNRDNAKEEAFFAAQTPFQQQLSDIWCETLGLEKVSIDSTLFSLGGHSLLVIKLMASINKQCGLQIETKDLFGYPTIRSFAEFVENKQYASNDSLISYLSTFKDGFPNLFCLPGAGSLSSSLSHLAAELMEQFNVIGFEYLGVFSNVPFHETMNHMASYYIEQINTIQPTGVVNLMGHSFGGILALQMAIELQQAGREVRFVSVDSYLVPKYLPTALLEDEYENIVETQQSEAGDDMAVQAMIRLQSLANHQLVLMKEFDGVPSPSKLKHLFVYTPPSAA